jgi:hypothetical protein
MPNRRELYRSPNGDAWFLGRERRTAMYLSSTSQMRLLVGDCRTLSWGTSYEAR